MGCPRLDGLICSGDLATYCTAGEYAAAVAFLTRFKDEFSLAPERIVLVPGNHDLSWEFAQAAYDRGDQTIYDRADATERRRWIVEGTQYQVRDEGRYGQRFHHFSSLCCELITGERYPVDYPDQFAFHHWPDLGVLVLSLNSAWEIDHYHNNRAGIHPGAVSRALNVLRTRADWTGCLKIAVWHHPLASDEPSRITDHGFLERLAQAGFQLGLHGHIHKAEASQYSYDKHPAGRRLDIIAAGTFGAPSRQWAPGYPLQYNLLRLSGQQPDKSLTVETRRREQVNGAWKPDARWLQGPGQDPLSRYFIEL